MKMQSRFVYSLSILIAIGAVITFVGWGGCTEQETKTPDWPKHVLDNIWIPKEAEVDRYLHRLSYEIVYNANACYPAQNLINEMVASMTSRGWKRLKHDPVNPGSTSPPNHAIAPAPKWTAGLDKDYTEVYGWDEFWEDNEKNIVEYSLRYRLNRGEPVERACSLSGVSAYIARDDLKNLLKAFQAMPVKPPGGP